MVAVGAIIVAAVSFKSKVLVFSDGIRIQRFASKLVFTACDIISIALEDKLPRHTIQLNGSSTQKKIFGVVATKGEIKSAQFDINNIKEGLFIHLTTTKGHCFINLSSAEETEALYNEMKSTIQFQDNSDLVAPKYYNGKSILKQVLIPLIVSFVIIIISVLFVSISAKSTRVEVSDKKIEIKGAYGKSIDIDGIKTLEREDRIDADMRLNGIETSNVSIGKYRLDDGRECHLYILGRTSHPSIIIETQDDELFFIRMKTEAETDSIYNLIKKHKQ